jgi:hypothetical protein
VFLGYEYVDIDVRPHKRQSGSTHQSACVLRIT